jgi:acyl-CoA synthetase (AMP-forming)/AMP-acid ligase II/acyl carrier protein
LKEFFDLADKLLENPGFESLFRLSADAWRENVYAEYPDGKRTRRMTYGELEALAREAASRIARELAELPKNSFVALVEPNSPYWGALFWGIVMAGYCPLLVDPNEEEEEMNALFAEAGVEAAVSRAEIRSGTVKSIRVSLSDPGSAAPGELGFADSGRGGADAAQDGPGQGFGERMALYSSGTSGRHKICVFSGEGMSRQVDAARSMPASSRDIMYGSDEGALKILALLPFYHIFGFVAVFLWYTFFGRTLVFLPDLLPSTILATCRKRKVSHIFAPPLLWNNLYKKTLGVTASTPARLLHHKTFGTNVRYMISGGGVIAPKVIARLNDLGYPLYNGYGATETGVTYVCLSPDPKGRKDANVGAPLHGVEYRLLPTEGRTATGRLVLSSPFLHEGVLSGGEYEARAEGPYDTGDIASVNKAGRCRILGRDDGILSVPSGEKVMAEELESVFSVLDGVALCFAGMAPPGFGGGVMLIVEAAPGADLSALNEAVAAENAKLPLGRRASSAYLSKAALPVAAGFKIKRNELLSRFISSPSSFVRLNLAAGNSHPAGSVDSAVADRVRKLLSGVIGVAPGDIGDNDDLIVTLGVDSFDYAEFIAGIGASFSVDIPMTDIGNLRTVADFSVYIMKHGAKERTGG